jgi:preprotein translocase subunit SecD
VRGLAHVDEEWLRYDAQGGERGLFGTQIAAHEAGAQMRIFEDDLVRTLLASRGELEFLRAPKQTPPEERARFAAWQAANPDAPLRTYDALAREAGGPPPGQLWRRHRSSRECVLLERPSQAQARFGNADLAELSLGKDDLGNPALSFGLAKERQGEFSDWTESLRGEGLAIVLDEEILVLATVRSRLPGAGLIAGGVDGFSIGEAHALLQLLRQPRLPLAPLRVTLEFLR